MFYLLILFKTSRSLVGFSSKLPTLTCQINGDPNNQRNFNKLPKFNKRGVKANGGGSELSKRLKMVIKQRKEQKQVVIKNKAKIYIQKHISLP